MSDESEYPVSTSFKVEKWQHGSRKQAVELLAEEVPVALEYNGISHAVMLATPADLEDFALGFSITEGILSSPKELYGCEISGDDTGIRITLEIASERFFCLKEACRNLFPAKPHSAPRPCMPDSNR